MSGQKRRSNFRLEDLAILADTVADQKQVLFGKFSNSVTAKSKMKIWDKIAAQINASNDNAVRTGEEVRKKWTDWASSIKMKNAKRKVSRRMTGGGVGVAEATDTELKVSAVIGQDATDGFGGWIDTEAMVGIPLAKSPAPPAPSPEDDQAQDIETHQEVGLPVGQPMTATSGRLLSLFQPQCSQRQVSSLRVSLQLEHQNDALPLLKVTVV